MKNACLYEAHVQTTDLEEAIKFYQSIDLVLAYVISDRVAFFWLGESKKKEQMLGVWQVTSDQFKQSHFALHLPYAQFMNVPNFLSDKGIHLVPSFGLDTSEPIVHAWMPAASYYFEDKDGNSLEYITVLEGEPIPELGAVHLSAWQEANKKR
ncbi:VOC family protein [Anaerobacillus sp. CMMVII]|uniref:VOC family protein n=1 Tax=Anaerobacillus sp. CMMVII TaxID=2755588 RepID=UPI0021B80CA2|nr:VOC family protein [Anaerobacillus sp. CMMVII]MCT8137208.1 VOC family protein [Anaerobacillus sp. CMMVII]